MSGALPAAGDALLRRVQGEFLEMPGLRLTRSQAQRLWGLDEWTCLGVLEFLVDARFLYRSGDGMYTRLSDGWSAYPPPRVAPPDFDGAGQRRQRPAAGPDSLE